MPPSKCTLNPLVARMELRVIRERPGRMVAASRPFRLAPDVFIRRNNDCTLHELGGYTPVETASEAVSIEYSVDTPAVVAA